MKRIITLIFIILPGLLLAQKDEQYKPLNELGWQTVSFSAPEDLTETDIGQVTYLLRITEKGRVSSIEILSNSFQKNVEKKWRRSIKKMVLTRADRKPESIIYKGTFHISRMYCSDDENQK